MRLTRVTLVFGVLCVGVSIWIRLAVNASQYRFPQGDDVAFLNTAAEIAEEGGALALIPRMLQGTYAEANRHPLPVMVLASFASRTPDFFRKAEWLMSMLSVGYVFLLAGVFWRGIAPWAGGMAALLWATNYFFLDHAVRVSAEPFLMISVLLGWVVITRVQTTKQALVFGGLCGLAYLSKVTGIFMLPAMAGALLHRAFVPGSGRYGRQSALWFLCVGVGFLVVSFPLLVRNIRVYGNPIHNQNGALLFLTSGEERRNPSLYNSPDFSVISTLGEQSLRDMSVRLFRGMVHVSVSFSHLVLFDRGGALGAIILALFVLLGWWSDPYRTRAWFSALLFGCFFLFFSWYFPISGHYRYLLPVLFLLYFYPLFFLNQFLRERVPASLPRILSLGVGFLSAALLFFTVRNVGWKVFPRTVDLPREYREVLALVQDVPEQVRYLNGPGHRFQVSWLSGTARKELEMPTVKTFEELYRFTSDFSVQYVLITAQAIAGREDLLGSYYEISENSLIEKAAPPGWELVSSGDEYLWYRLP